MRRRPGPPWLSARFVAQISPLDRQRHSVERQSSIEEESSTVVTFSTPRPVVSSGTNTLTSSEVSRDARSRAEHSTQLNVLPEQEQHLLQKYLALVHDAIPIFSSTRFLPSIGDSLYSLDLVLTLLFITAKLTGVNFAAAGFGLDSRIDLMLSSGLLQEEMCGDAPSLDQFHKAYLMAFYEFHQFPGQQAWMRVGKPTRMAYWMGLDRVDSVHPYNPSWDAMGHDEREDWRLVWWFVYRLDTYVNMSSGTPYLIDETLVRTAFMQE
ncbi:hypothetical protein QQZ08_005423 [Neonectria magnoliae]|uniref:Xylanolytic transcriptional activator regulatory domain-containing protein n=1 Tax=Neonectria magnoliae TaxID=2732573 RepID=A0ABR1I382_9HYPO